MESLKESLQKLQQKYYSIKKGAQSDMLLKRTPYNQFFIIKILDERENLFSIKSCATNLYEHDQPLLHFFLQTRN